MIYDHVGHDPDWEKISPGTVLLYRVLERAFADDAIEMFDFTEGEGTHKERFATQETRCADVFFFAPTAKNLFAVASHAATGSLTRVGVNLLAQLGAKERIKRALRNFRR
jgi:CelD/BcsL family acetyltransferase involved in cellulose biosynthesis